MRFPSSPKLCAFALFAVIVEALFTPIAQDKQHGTTRGRCSRHEHPALPCPCPPPRRSPLLCSALLPLLCSALAACQAAAADASGEKKSNAMRTIRIEKLVINCCVGESGDRLTRAAKVSSEGRCSSKRSRD